MEFEKIYERLEVTLEERGESFYNPVMPAMVQELRARQKAVVSDGATVIVTGARHLRNSFGGPGHPWGSLGQVGPLAPLWGFPKKTWPQPATLPTPIH